MYHNGNLGEDPKVFYSPKEIPSHHLILRSSHQEKDMLDQGRHLQQIS